MSIPLTSFNHCFAGLPLDLLTSTLLCNMVLARVPFPISACPNCLSIILTLHTCQPGRGQMTEIFPIDNTHALTRKCPEWTFRVQHTKCNHRRTFKHNLRVTHTVTHGDKHDAFSEFFIADSRTCERILSERHVCFRTGLTAYHRGTNYRKVRNLN